MKLLSVFFFLFLALASPALADSITLRFTGLTITNPGGQTTNSIQMGSDLVASSGPLMLKASTSTVTVNVGQNFFDAAWIIIAPNTNLASLNGYSVSFNTEVNGASVGAVNAVFSLRSDGVLVLTITNPNQVFGALGRSLQLTYTISPNPVGIGTGNYDIQGSLSEVPEPQTLLLLSAGLLTGARFLRRRNRNI